MIIKEAILSGQHITKAYPLPDGGKLLALNDVSVEVPRGKLTILKGPQRQRQDHPDEHPLRPGSAHGGQSADGWV